MLRPRKLRPPKKPPANNPGGHLLMKKAPVRERRGFCFVLTVPQAARRSTIIFLISAMALAGFRPLGQTLAQFMIVWQR